MYKMICIDIDGTLIRPDLTVSDRVAQAIGKAKEKGLIIALSTGRMHKSALMYSDELGLTDPIVSSNGAYVSERDGSSVYYEENLSGDDVLLIQDVLNRHDTKINWYNHGTMYISEYRDYVGRYEALAKTLPEDRKILIKYLNDDFTLKHLIEETGNAIQKGIVFPKMDRISSIREQVSKNQRIKVVSSGVDNLEFTSYLADKGLGVLALAKAKGIHPDEIIAIGDSENDLSMLKVVGMPVAMGNAMQNVMDVAKYVTDTNINDGVAKMIEKLVLSEG
ncbi:Cof-type HAD-IIB family hydrolase [Proteiniclasticum sp. C24MP]|uniref:Cof-type HAD-IIB family hydrolase n=1 Tax=Proteiniclasticum sp. C24MP TaxID=3374101 RepID=UPI0037552D42